MTDEEVDSLQLPVKLSGMPRSTLIEIRAGRSRPHRKNQEMLTSIVRKLGQLTVKQMLKQKPGNVVTISASSADQPIDSMTSP
jgi:hypothetical protein